MFKIQENIKQIIYEDRSRLLDSFLPWLEIDQKPEVGDLVELNGRIGLVMSIEQGVYKDVCIVNLLCGSEKIAAKYK